MSEQSKESASVVLNGVTLEANPVEVWYLRQEKRPELSVDNLSKKGVGLRLLPLSVQTETSGEWIGAPLDPAKAPMLNAEQFKALYRAVGAQSGWLPPECDKNFFDKFKDSQLYALVEDDKVVGFTSVSEGNVDFVGMLPSQQGRGLGAALLREAADKAWSYEGVESVTLDTVPKHDMGRKGVTPAADIYLRNSFELDPTRGSLVDPDSKNGSRTGKEVKSATDNDDALFELNYPEYYQKEAEKTLGRRASREDVGHYYEVLLNKSGINSAIAIQKSREAAEMRSVEVAKQLTAHTYSLTQFGDGDFTKNLAARADEIMEGGQQQQETAKKTAKKDLILRN